MLIRVAPAAYPGHGGAVIPVMFSCEHATCAVPEAWRESLREAEDAVASSEGWEPGALNLAQGFAMKFRTPLIHGDVTRLLVDLDGEGDARWSRFSSQFTEAQQSRLIDRHIRPHRDQLNQRLRETLRRHPTVAHILVHTDAAADGTIALEFPAAQDRAGDLARAWRDALDALAPDLQVRTFPHPSAPVAATELLETFGPEAYLPVTLRVAQTFFLEGRPCRWERVKKALLDSLPTALETLTAAPESSSSAPR